MSDKSLTVLVVLFLQLVLIGVSIAAARKRQKHKYLYGLPIVCGLVSEATISYMLHKDFSWFVALFFSIFFYGISWLELKSQR